MAKRRQEEVENAWGMAQVDELNSTKYQNEQAQKKKTNSLLMNSEMKRIRML